MILSLGILSVVALSSCKHYTQVLILSYRSQFLDDHASSPSLGLINVLHGRLSLVLAMFMFSPKLQRHRGDWWIVGSHSSCFSLVPPGLGHIPISRKASHAHFSFTLFPVGSWDHVSRWETRSRLSWILSWFFIPRGILRCHVSFRA